eukprot:Protomagalhaensia_sp_Gyna_25__4869@NODE_50_length_6124_cov_50_591454_g37_i0_p1_GENE_NODE_50_length_6124_cov_50_591454_g37_i0NODE_50_length_6124_cov_50_591454_g37_i0_p1_ORF_typecomplete_len447_score79_71TPR_16/PF13432_6/1_2TPR_16/PF13432_6/3_1e05TPR_21/PF09976_9/3_5e05ANAPC3/PF12895_7/0_00031TPR_19/PF14559_6/1TPR_19/PF14559_6/0_42TPR_MalT/PF17874_1/0_032TPR_MalT/PF17874_1/35BTAD/PF03704_17/0_028TPR_2/PF07719_17/1e04TPR_2/PF07719_17/3_8e02TPR_2/PF07719_17/0_3TPR_5/PF12688_7/0_14TPR_5/PF12688_7/4_9
MTQDVLLLCIQSRCLDAVAHDKVALRLILDNSDANEKKCFTLLRGLLKTKNEIDPASNGSTEATSPTSSDVVDLGSELVAPKVQPVSFPSFELSDVPTAELRRRLNRGEIAPRDEWIPSEDTTHKKPVSTQEALERLTFGERIRSEAESKFANNELEEAATLFIQGVRLLEFSKCDVEVTLGDQIQSALRRFRLNLARVNLKLGHFRESIKFLDDQLNEDSHDGTALYLRGRSLELVGDYSKAVENYYSLYRDPIASDEEKQAGLYALHRLKKTNVEDGKKMKQIIDRYHQELPDEDFTSWEFIADPSENKETSTAYTPGRKTKSQLISSGLKLPRVKERSTMEYNLMALLRLYTSAEVAPLLWNAKVNADFEEVRIIKALRKLMPSIVAPLLRSFGYGDDQSDYWEMKRRFDSDVHYYRFAAEFSETERKQFSDLVTQIREVLME